jgi:hypothetical protein
MEIDQVRKHNGNGVALFAKFRLRIDARNNFGRQYWGRRRSGREISSFTRNMVLSSNVA